jgi:hypothetical protein
MISFWNFPVNIFRQWVTEIPESETTVKQGLFHNQTFPFLLCHFSSSKVGLVSGNLFGME